MEAREIIYRLNKICSYNERLPILYKYGYTVLAMTTLMCEETFVFATDDEAQRAFEHFENPATVPDKDKLSGWWYDQVNFPAAVEHYIHNLGTHPEVLAVSPGQLIPFPDLKLQTSIPPALPYGRCPEVGLCLQYTDNGYINYKIGFYNYHNKDWYIREKFFNEKIKSPQQVLGWFDLTTVDFGDIEYKFPSKLIS